MKSFLKINPWVVTITLLAIAKLCFLVWAADKGFEVTDEGYYLLWFHTPHLYAPDLHLNYYYVIQALFGWVNWDIAAMRLGGLATEIIAVGAITWGAAIYVKARLPQLYSPKLILFWAVGGFMATFIAEHPRSLSYDSTTHALMAIGAGVLLKLFATDNRLSRRATIFLFSVLGFVIAAQFIVKFSSSILLLSLFGAAVITIGRKNIPWKSAVPSMLGGALVLLALVFLFVISPSQFAQYYQIGYNRIAGLGYSPIDIVLKTYLAKDSLHFAINVLPSVIVFAAALSIFNKQSIHIKVWVATGAGLAVFAAQCILFPTDYFERWPYRLADLMLYLFATGTILLAHFKPGKWWWLFAAILFAIPFVCAIGSARNLAMAVFSYMPAWLMLAASLWYYVGQKTGTGIYNWINNGVLGYTIAVFIAVFMYPNYLPHGMAAPIWQQTQRAVLHDGVKLDPPTAAFVKQTQALLQRANYLPGDYILALYDLPGLVYLMQGYSPQVPWYFGEHTRATVNEAITNTCWHINEIREKKVFVIKPVSIHTMVANCLSYSTLQFPAKYSLVGLVYNPYCKCEQEIWAPE